MASTATIVDSYRDIMVIMNIRTWKLFLLNKKQKKRKSLKEKQRKIEKKINEI